MSSEAAAGAQGAALAPHMSTRTPACWLWASEITSHTGAAHERVEEGAVEGLGEGVPRVGGPGRAEGLRPVQCPSLDAA